LPTGLTSHNVIKLPEETNLSKAPASNSIRDLAASSGRRLTVFATAVVMAGAPLVALAGAPSASAAGCPAVEVVFARDTGQPAGVGREGQAFVSSLKSQVNGESVGVYAVNYPASDDFISGAAAGANDASAHIQGTVANCPNTKLVLGGYSQGAAVIDAITTAATPGLGFNNPMPPEVADHVAAAVVFGNPSNKVGQPLTTLSPLYGAKAIDLCNGADPVCSSGDDVPAHSTYVQAGVVQQGADFAASRL
jgi:cutinase